MFSLKNLIKKFKNKFIFILAFILVFILNLVLGGISLSSFFNMFIVLAEDSNIEINNIDKATLLNDNSKFWFKIGIISILVIVVIIIMLQGPGPFDINDIPNINNIENVNNFKEISYDNFEEIDHIFEDDFNKIDASFKAANAKKNDI